MNKSKLLLLIALTVFGLAIISCSNGSDEPATALIAEQFDKLNENKENNNRRFCITGYPNLSHSDIKLQRDLDVTVNINTEPNGKGQTIGSIPVGYKKYKSGMYIPDQFTPDDLQIFDKEGNQLGVNDKITVSFTMKLDTKREPNSALTKFEKDERGIPREVDKAPQYYGQGPVDIVIEKAQ